jgi:uncharacterized membrane protein YphA (DoxX/SURF4 family)
LLPFRYFYIIVTLQSLKTNFKIIIKMNTSIKNKILFTTALLFGLFFINAGLNKFFDYMPMPKDMPPEMIKIFNAFKEIGWLLPLVGLAEIVGGLLIIIPRTRALGALIVFPVMVGICLTNFVQNKSGLPMAIILGIILTWIMYQNKHKYSILFSKMN